MGLLVISPCYPHGTPVRHTSRKVVNIDYNHGQLPAAQGVHNIQVMRANREHPEWAEGHGWTYNHAPMMAYWRGTFLVSYLSNRESESVPPGQTYLQTSRDGYHWDFPRVLFPTYRLPDGTTKPGVAGVAKDTDTVMHQRMGFHLSKQSGRLFALGYHGICLAPGDKPNDGKGVGRVIREINDDGTMGGIFFIRYNHGWSEGNTAYPFYRNCPDPGFVAACEEILADPLTLLEWAEESDPDDPLVPALRDSGKAFCHYFLPDGRIVGMWKSRLSGVSSDGGKTWTTGLTPGLFTGSAKMWGQRTSDGLYAQVFNPSLYRWPMAVTVSQDGLTYGELLLVHGEVPPLKYSGGFKNQGPQYLRGINPGHGVPPDGDMWVAYSVSKEDIWVSRVAIPILGGANQHIDEDLSAYANISQLRRWNLYSPVWARVAIDRDSRGRKGLKLSDRDPYNHAKAEMLFPPSGKLRVEFTLVPHQSSTGMLMIELQDERHSPAICLRLDQNGMISTRRSFNYRDVLPYRAGEAYHFRMEIDADSQAFSLDVNGQSLRSDFFAPMKEFSKIVFRTGAPFENLSPVRLAEGDFTLERASEPVPEAAYYILNLKTSALETTLP